MAQRRIYDPICSIEGCGKPHRTRGWCITHYTRWYRTGDPLTVRPSAPPPRPPRKTHCPHGHPFTGDNLRIRIVNGYRAQICKTCNRESARRIRAKQRAAKPTTPKEQP